MVFPTGLLVRQLFYGIIGEVVFPQDCWFSSFFTGLLVRFTHRIIGEVFVPQDYWWGGFPNRFLGGFPM